MAESIRRPERFLGPWGVGEVERVVYPGCSLGDRETRSTPADRHASACCYNMLRDDFGLPLPPTGPLRSPTKAKVLAWSALEGLELRS